MNRAFTPKTNMPSRFVKAFATATANRRAATAVGALGYRVPPCHLIFGNVSYSLALFLKALQAQPLSEDAFPKGTDTFVLVGMEIAGLLFLPASATHSHLPFFGVFPERVDNRRWVSSGRIVR